MLFVIRPSWCAQLSPSQLETFALICSMLGVYLKVDLMKTLAALLHLCSEVLKILCFALMETWNLMTCLTLVLKLCLSALSIKIHLNCVRVEAIVYFQFLLKAAKLCSWISRGLHAQFLQIAVVCYVLWLVEMLGARRRWCEQEKLLNISDLSTSR